MGDGSTRYYRQNGMKISWANSNRWKVNCGLRSFLNLLKIQNGATIACPEKSKLEVNGTLSRHLQFGI